jgi:hypothetical protein
MEKAWSAALDTAALESAHSGLERRIQVLTTALVAQLAARDEELEKAGVNVALPEWPVSPEHLLECLAVSTTLEGRRALLVIAQLQAVELVAEAFSAVAAPSGTRIQLLTGKELARWWESGAFALLRSRAELLQRVSIEIEAVDAQILKDVERPSREGALAGLVAASVAYRRGDPEAALLHALSCAAVAVPRSGGDSDRWRRLRSMPDFSTLGELLERAEAIVQEMLDHGPAAAAYALPVAGELLPRLQRFVSSPPVTED